MTRFLRLRVSRNLLLFLAVVALGFALGCGGQKGEPERADGRTVINFWQFWTEPKVKAVITNAVSEFEAANPEYKVEITDLTWANGYQKIVAAFAGNRVPDLLELGSDWIPEFADRGVLMDLTAEWARMNESYGGWAPAIYNDACWALPWYLSTRVMYQNDDLAMIIQGDDRPHPIIWRDLLKNAGYATASQPRMWGYGVQAAEPHRLYKKFLPFLWSAGGRILSDDMTECALVSDEARMALAFIVETTEVGMIDKQAQLDDLFVDGKLLYHLSGDWLHERLQRSGKTLKYSTFLMPFPGPGLGSQTSFAGGEFLVIPRRATQRVAALKLARHLLKEKHIFNLCIATGNATPVHLNVARNPYFSEDSVRSIFIHQLALSRSPPVHPRWLDIEKVLEWGIEQALYQRLTVNEALDQTCEKIDAILVEYWRE